MLNNIKITSAITQCVVEQVMGLSDRLYAVEDCGCVLIGLASDTHRSKYNEFVIIGPDSALFLNGLEVEYPLSDPGSLELIMEEARQIIGHKLERSRARRP